MNTNDVLLPASRRIAAALAGCLALASGAQVPSQSPLLSRVDDPPPPSVMLTIDDSGSMQAHYMPEGSEQVNGTTVSLPVLNSMSDMVDVFPGDPLHTGYPGTTIPKGESFGDPTDTSSVFAREMRSSAVNTIFYNPAVLYITWVMVTASGGTYTVGRYDAGAAGAALWDPADITQGTTNLLQTYDIDKDGNGGLTSSWCSDGANCSSMSRSYHPMLYYLLRASANPNSVGSYDTYDLNAKTINGTAVGDGAWPTYPGRVCTAWSNCCTATACTYAAEQQNFANWFVFYRTRTHLVKGAVSEALNNVNGKIRVALGTINSTGHTIDGQTTDVLLQGMRMLDSQTTAKPPAVANKTLYDVLAGPLGMQHLSPAGSTPLRAATYTVGQYFRRTAGPADPGSPWNTTPGMGGDTSVLACRRAYMLLTTDGYYNDDVSGYSNVANVDGVNGPDYAGPDGNQDPMGLQPTQYIADSWYPDNNSQMLADFAMYNYVNDLQPGVDNRVGHAGDDIAFWQHLNMFTVGLGVMGTIDPSQVPNLKGKRDAWGTDKIDDLLHAAVDTHGQFFSAKDSPTLSSALAAALGSAASSSLKESGVATSTMTLNGGTVEYVPSYISGLWSGDVQAFNLGDGSQKWDADVVLPGWSQRKLYTWNGTGSVPFDTTHLPANLKSQIDATDPDDLINFIRGDRSNEGAGKPYRVRSGVLGDFVDSTPILVWNNVDLGYDALPGAPGYRGWINNVIASRQLGLFVQGANDGMLHVFRSDTGAETYGYVPGAELSNLHVLAQTNYGTALNYHQDFVDGPQIETHAFLSGAWSDLVVGSFGAGAKGLYALQMANDLSGANASALLWEQSGDADMGYLLSNVAVGKTADPNGQWVALVGNGPGSTSGHAVLLIVDLATGAILNRVTVDSGTGTGLMGVQPVYDSLRQVTAVYAGDLKGNLWRIELPSVGGAVTGFNGQPFFKAINANGQSQPISVQPLAVPYSGGGNIVLFGTGRLVTDADQDDTTTQSFYGVLDPTLQGASSVGVASPFAADIAAGTPRAHLQEQDISVDSTTINKPLDQRLFDVTSNNVDYTTQFGWFMDLAPVTATQRVLFPAVQVNQFVLINTISPAPQPQDACSPTTGLSAYFLLPAFTGAQYSSAVWDTNGDGKFDEKDSTAAGYSADAGGKTSIVQGGSGQGENLNPNGGNRDYKVPSGPKSRVWQQLMTPPF